MLWGVKREDLGCVVHLLILRNHDRYPISAFWAVDQRGEGDKRTGERKRIPVVARC